jgi:hypothetical protein
MLVAVLVLCILSLISNIVLLAGFWDVYKTLREVKRLAQCNADQEVSKHLQDIGAGKSKPKSFADLHKRKKT